MAQETSTDLSTRLFIAILSAIFVFLIGFNSWLTRRTITHPINSLTEEINKFSGILTETRINHGSRITAVERDVEGLDRRVTRLEDE